MLFNCKLIYCVMYFVFNLKALWSSPLLSRETPTAGLLAL